jgi:uncharacterized membrane protein YdjX (TVP38/TMEM64 family)
MATDSSGQWETVHLLLKMTLLLSVVCAAAFTVIEFEDILKAFVAFIAWVGKHPRYGELAIMGGYIIAETLFFPRSVLTVATGYALRKAYGNSDKTLLVGIPLVSFAGSIASVIHFGMGRYIFSETAKNICARYPIFKALDKALVTDGFILMTLLHLSPMVPFSILNFCVGMSAMSFKDFCLSFIGVLPGSIVFILIGTTLSDISDLLTGKSNLNAKEQQIELAFVSIGSVLGIFAIIWTSLVTKKYFDEIVAENESIE